MYKNLLAEIARNGLTKRDLALEMGMSDVSFRKKIRGQREFVFSEIEFLLKKFKGSYEYLFQTSEDGEQ